MNDAKIIKILLAVTVVGLLGTITYNLLRNRNQQEQIHQYNNELDQLKMTLKEEEQVISNQAQKIAMYEDKGNGIKAYGRLRVKNGKLVNQEEKNVQLKGFSTHGLTWYPRYMNANALKTIKKYGANVIRLAMYTEQEGSYHENMDVSKDLAYIGIENALAQDMYVIMDWHVLQDETPTTYIDLAVDFFDEVSSVYGNAPGIIYEICNEPNGKTKWGEIKKYAETVIPVIRKNAPDSIIIIGTPNYSSDLSEVMDAPLEFDNIMYTWHGYIDVSQEETFKSSQLKKAIDIEMPVFVTEWGIRQSDKNSSLHMESAESFLSYLRDNKISWCNWSLSNKDEIYSAIKPDCTKLSGWTEEDLTFSGKLIFRHLGNE